MTHEDDLVVILCASVRCKDATTHRCTACGKRVTRKRLVSLLIAVLATCRGIVPASVGGKGRWWKFTEGDTLPLSKTKTDMFLVSGCACCTDAEKNRNANDLLDGRGTDMAPSSLAEDYLGGMPNAVTMTKGKELEERPEVVVEGEARYTGQWLGNKRYGHGCHVRPDGQRYEGQFVDDKAHGHGIC
eukprot:2352354-Amphidinium_carterae.1